MKSYYLSGECQCDPGFFGELCDGTRSQPPRVIKEAFEDLCDTNIKPCKTFLLYGDNFIEGTDFRCKFTELKVWIPFRNTCLSTYI